MNIVSETSDISHWDAEAERGKPIPWLERLNDIVGMLVDFRPRCWSRPRSLCSSWV